MGNIIIINESQLDILREFENDKIMCGEFENNLRDYIKELHDHPCKPNYGEFFKKHNIPEKELLNKMLDFGLIKKNDSITEPEDADGKKRSMYSRSYTIYNKNFDDNVNKLYDAFFNKGVRRPLDECDAGMAGGGFAGGSFTDAGGATTTDSTGDYQYDVPFPKVMRRKIKGQEDNNSVTSTESNIDLGPTSDRTPGKVAVNRKK